MKTQHTNLWQITELLRQLAHRKGLITKLRRALDEEGEERDEINQHVESQCEAEPPAQAA